MAPDPLRLALLSIAVAFAGACTTTPFRLDRTDVSSDVYGHGDVGVGVDDIKVSINGLPLPALAKHVSETVNRRLDVAEGAKGLATTVELTESGPTTLTLDHAFLLKVTTTLPGGATVETTDQRKVNGSSDAAIGCGLVSCATVSLAPIVVLGSISPFFFPGFVPLIAAGCLMVPGLGLVLGMGGLVDSLALIPQSERASTFLVEVLRRHASELNRRLSPKPPETTTTTSAVAPTAKSAETPPPLPQELRIWFVERGGASAGPSTASEVRKLLRAGTLTARSLVWRDGFAAWIPLEDVPELRPTPPPLPERR